MLAKKFFTKELLKWNKYDNDRVMPWKFEKDPYKIWISEIILQQTRVSQGLEYYNRFIKRFPTAKSIAIAPEHEVFKLWEGLGYYTRCKNIIETAKLISEKFNGIFPSDYDTILSLKGIGSYTASAITSFAFNLPYAVLDGNVFRVLSRYFGIKIPVDNLQGKKYFSELAFQLLDKKQPGVYNQSIMDFGATICKPLPLCEICALKSRCVAYLQGIQLELPVKEKMIIKKNRWLYYLVISYRNKFYIRKRIEKDIWQNLYEFIVIETPKSFTIKKLQTAGQFISILQANDYQIQSISQVYKQQLTHQTINGQFIKIKVRSPLNLSNYELASVDKIKQLPFPKFITTYLKD
ncbi:MAG TPA: A/G-specific adenine glycosylase [Chitinophagaceae bacterium]|nr:A/G-specific adenine glycosylase [Chitinophagaceae bacterium]